MASIINRLASGVQRALTASPVLGGGISSWLYGGGVGITPHEPFAGAWQRNADSARGAGIGGLTSFTAVFACVDIISCDVSRLPLRVLQQQYKPDGKPAGRTEFKNHPAWKTMRKPNSFQTSQQFVQYYLANKLTTGNSYVLLLRDGRGIPNEMHVLDSRRVEPLVDDEGNIYYRVSPDKIAGLKESVIIPARDIVHDRGVCLFHPLVGVSPLFAAGASAMQGARIQMNSDTFFANMSRSSGVLSAPGKIDPAVAKKMQLEWEQNYSKQGLGKVAVLANGLKYEPMTITAVDAELVNQLRWVVEDIGRAYHVPGYKLGDLNKVTFKNAEQMASDYLGNCLSYHIQAFQQCFNAAFGLPDDISIEFDTDKLFEIETDLRYANHSEAISSGWKAINEVRNEEDLPPVEGGDEPRVQVQYVPLSKATGEGVAGIGAPAATPPAPVPKPKPASSTPKTLGSGGVDVAKLLSRFSSNILNDDEAS